MFAQGFTPGLRKRAVANRVRRGGGQRLGHVGRFPIFQIQLRNVGELVIVRRQPLQGMIQLIVELLQPFRGTAVTNTLGGKHDRKCRVLHSFVHDS